MPGHEWAGTVASLGAGAAAFGWRVGQRVAGTSHAGCGYCRMCVTGRYNLCEAYGDPARGHRQYGHYSPGAYAEYVVHSVRSVFAVPDGLPSAEAALLDPASIALHTAKRAAFAPGDAVAVLGLGPMGLLVVMCAFALGAGAVIAVGRGDRLARATELGALPVDYTAGDPVAAVRALTGGRGAAAVAECAGGTETLSQAVGMASRGGRVAVIGIPTGPGADAAPFPLRRAVLDEIEVRGVRANQNTCAEVLPLMASRRVDAGRLITHRFPLGDFAGAGDLRVPQGRGPQGDRRALTGRSYGAPRAQSVPGAGRAGEVAAPRGMMRGTTTLQARRQEARDDPGHRARRHRRGGHGGAGALVL